MASETGKKTILLGVFFCGSGIVANAVTYAGTASTKELTYVLAWGAIIFGLIQIVRGALHRQLDNQP
ncbi:MAG TPA: hypothetical protein PKA58_22935 [Polyangium sp.]|nr:hypothetical protein [Polyangium sp.]